MKRLLTLVFLLILTIPIASGQGRGLFPSRNVTLTLDQLTWETFLDHTAVRFSITGSDQGSLAHQHLTPEIVVRVVNDGGPAFNEKLILAVPYSGSVIIPKPPSGDYTATISFAGSVPKESEKEPKEIVGFSLGGHKAQAVVFRSKVMPPQASTAPGAAQTPVNATDDMLKVDPKKEASGDK